ncbi:MAG TPA: SpoIID/LytB domain-containing protein [Patescibacteria group bacterium]
MKFPKPIRLFLFLLSFSLILFFSISLVKAQDCGADLDCQIQKIQREIDALTPAQENNKKELSGLNSQLADLKNRILGLSSQLDDLASQIEGREEDLAFTRKIFEEKTANHYKFLRTYDPIAPFFSASDASTVFRELIFRQRAADEDRLAIDKYAVDLSNLKKDKDNLEKNKASLASLQSKVDERAKFLASEVAKVDSYLGELSAKQQELAALKAGGFQTSVGETPDTLEPCSGSPNSSNFCDPGFRPAFAAFSFGAPHRTGMSQYGAYGRSKAGQSYQDILSAYYQGSQLATGYAEPANITVAGIGTVSFEDNYLMGIYEIPESWGDSGGFEALKAQAIAARTYSLYATGNGARSICTDESCQVYKPALKTGKWKDAVNATRGVVLLKGGSPAPAFYASTAGGWTISQWGWSGIKDAPGSWPDTAYEKVGGSPWFYKGWYKSRSGATCGKSNPWLTSEQLADILNANVVLTQGGGDQSRISPTDTDCWGGNPYSVSELSGLGGFTSVSGVSVIYGNDGSTQSVTFSTNKGSVTISGDDFKKAFNLRAPGYIGLKSSLFNIEKL